MSIRSCPSNFFKQACVSIVFLLLAAQCSAQQTTDYKVHANIIYRFTKYIEWPGNKRNGDFVIGIVGDSPLYEELSTLTVGKTVGDQKIVIKRFANNAAFYNCSILFISIDQSRSLKRIALQTTGLPILLITEDAGLAKKGSCINFITVDDHLKLEINKDNILSRNMNVASELLKLATIITNDNVIANSQNP